MKIIIGWRALKILNEFPQGKVHSVFRNSFNAKFHEEIIGFVNKEDYLGPYTIHIDEISDFSQVFLLGQDIVFIKDGFILNNGKTITFENARVYEYTPCVDNPLDIQRVRKRIQTLKTLIKQILDERNNSETHQYCFDALIYNKFRDFKKSAVKYYKSDINLMALPPGAAELIGMGRGLTPSGDDFISGFMTAMIFLKLYISKNNPSLNSTSDSVETLKNTFLNFVYKNSSKTHILSYQMLKSAARGEGPKVMTDFMESIFSEHEQTLPEVNLQKLLSIGSTSGVDMAQGIYAANTAVLYRGGIQGNDTKNNY